MGGVHVPEHGKRPRSEQERRPLGRVAELPLDLFGFFLERENAEVKVPHLAPGQDEGEEDEHDVERRVAAPLVLEYLRPDESGRARSCKLRKEGDKKLILRCNIHSTTSITALHCTYRDWPPMTDVENGVEENTNEETRESRDLESDEDAVDRVYAYVECFMSRA